LGFRFGAGDGTGVSTCVFGAWADGEFDAELVVLRVAVEELETDVDLELVSALD
jgi:hypothetical protein